MGITFIKQFLPNLHFWNHLLSGSPIVHFWDHPSSNFRPAAVTCIRWPRPQITLRRWIKCSLGRTTSPVSGLNHGVMLRTALLIGPLAQPVKDSSSVMVRGFSAHSRKHSRASRLDLPLLLRNAFSRGVSSPYGRQVIASPSDKRS